MKLIEGDGGRFVFQLGKREKRLLFEILKLYPLVSASYQKLTKTGGPPDLQASQQLLEESLAAQKRENRKQLQAMLNEEGRFQENQAGIRFLLDVSQAEWLLQVLNDIRVGSWLALGSPDEKKGKPIQLNEKNVHYLLAMEVSGQFQMALLEAFDRPA